MRETTGPTTADSKIMALSFHKFLGKSYRNLLQNSESKGRMLQSSTGFTADNS